MHCWKRSLQHSTCKGHANGSTLPMANRDLIANLLIFTSKEGDKATSPSFKTCCAPMDTSGTSLEVLIATWHMQRGWDGEHFTHGKQILVCQSFTFYEWRGRRGNITFFCSTLRGNWGFQHISGSAHCKFIACKHHYKRGHSPNGNQVPNCWWLVVACAKGEQATLPSCASIGAHNVLL